MSQLQWFPGHMAKAKRQVAEDLSLVDVVAIVLDARIPRTSYNNDFRDLIGNKASLLVLNKEDLAASAVTANWLSYYRGMGQAAIALNAAQKQGVQQLQKKLLQLAEPKIAALLAKGRSRRPVRAMILGIPNTGKSTLVNALNPQASAKTANRPGVTRGKQWIRLSDKLELLDTPGILPPKLRNRQEALNLAVTGTLPQDIINAEEAALHLLKWLCLEAPQELKLRYNLTSPLTGEDGSPLPGELLLQEIGERRGLLLSGGKVSLEEASKLLLAEFRNGRLGRLSLEKPQEVSKRQSDEYAGK